VEGLGLVSPPPPLHAAGQSNGSFYLSWPALANARYQIQYRTNLTQTNWLNLGAPIPGGNSMVSVTDGIGANQQRFYRLALMP